MKEVVCLFTKCISTYPTCKTFKAHLIEQTLLSIKLLTLSAKTTFSISSQFVQLSLLSPSHTGLRSSCDL